MKPLIGITTGEVINFDRPWAPVTYGQSHTYSDAVIRAGGIPVLIPITQDLDTITELYGHLDGLLFAGGNDINPHLYGEEARPLTVEVSDIRDAVEVTLLGRALTDNKPILAICRGAQLLNVLCGGTLHQDILTDFPGAQDHDASKHRQNQGYVAHTLKVDTSSRLAEILGDTSVTANSLHHQAVKVVAPGLKAVAWAEDGVIEAVESLDASRFMIGLQCHPEALHGTEQKWDAIFSSFVASCQLPSQALSEKLSLSGIAD